MLKSKIGYSVDANSFKAGAETATKASGELTNAKLGFLYTSVNNDIKEVIIAISPTLEGETTALYISKLLENTKVIVSRIAYGIPMGADMEYLDPMTLSMALNNRNKIS